MFKNYDFDNSKNVFIYKNITFDPTKETVNDLLIINSATFSDNVGHYIYKLYKEFAGNNIGGDLSFANKTELPGVPSLTFSESFISKIQRLNTGNYIFKEVDYITQSQDYALFAESPFVGSIMRFMEQFFLDEKPPVCPIESADNPDWDTRYIVLSDPVSQVDFDKHYSMEISYNKYGTITKFKDFFRALTPFETTMLAVMLYKEFPGKFVFEWNMLVYPHVDEGVHKALVGELYLVPVFVSMNKRKSLYALDIY